MARIKSHKTVEQLAKKHGVSVSDLNKQLKIGIPIEHEHTKDQDLAKDIALQHLGEFPDYYTRLKKMEKTAKKLKEEHEQSRYCPLCDKREKRSECSYGENAWDKVSVKDEEYSMARSELKTIDDAVKRLMGRIGKGEGNLEAWVQSKITKAADYIDTAADYLSSGEMEESKSPLVDKILDEEKKKMKGKNPCWKGYEMIGTKKKGGKEVPNCVPESVTIQDADGNDYIEFIDIITPDPIKPISEAATRLQAQTGNLIAVMLSWRAKTYSLTMFFPQVKMPSRKDVEAEIQKVYPGSRVLQFNVTTTRGSQPIVQVQNSKSKNYLLNNKTIGEEVEISEGKKSEMPCNKPKAESHGSGETGKSHVVKACDGGKEKLIRFGQKGVKGSPKKKGESKEYASRRHRFQTRHAKNIAKGKMSAAYWSNRVKW